MSMNNPNAAAGWPPNPVQANPVPANGWPPNPAPANSWLVNPAPTNSWAMNPAPGYPAVANPAPTNPVPVYQPPVGPVPANTTPATAAPANAAPAAPTPADGCLAWDAEISDDGPEFLILPEGDYLGLVTEIERGRHEGSGKLPACPKVTIHMAFQTETGEARAQTNLFLVQKMEWKLSSFFRCIGFKKKGEPIRPDWKKVPGSWGRVHLRPGSYESGGQKFQINEIMNFLDYDPALMPPIPQTPQIVPPPQVLPATTAAQIPQAASTYQVQQTAMIPQAQPTAPAPPAPSAPAASPVQQTMQGLQGPAVPPGFTNVTGDIEPPW